MVVLGALPLISPMHPALASEPFHHDGWVYEEKYDGWQMLAYKDDTHVRLVFWNGREHTPRFPDIARAVAKLAADATLAPIICRPLVNRLAHSSG
jgi:bifunctional non-homologous end joining protein LigD